MKSTQKKTAGKFKLFTHRRHWNPGCTNGWISDRCRAATSWYFRGGVIVTCCCT